MGPDTLGDVFTIPLDGDRKPVPYLRSRFREVKAVASPDGREMFFLGDAGRVFAVGVTPSSDQLRFAIPAMLIQVDMRNPGHATPMLRYAVSRDGQRVMVARVPGSATDVSAPLTVVLNWTALLPQN